MDVGEEGGEVFAQAVVASLVGGDGEEGDVLDGDSVAGLEEEA